MYTERLSMENISAPDEYPPLVMGNLVAYDRQVIGVIGLENSGHSTFLDILSGKKQMKRGTIWINGELCAVGGRAIDAWWKKRIWTLYYHTELLGCMTVAENLVCPVMDVEKGRFINSRATIEYASSCFAEAGLDIDPRAKGDALPLIEQHIVFLLRAKTKGAQIIIIDDLTSLYTLSEIQLLGKAIRYLADAGITVVCKFNNIPSLVEHVDRLIVFRSGCVVKELKDADIAYAEIYRYMLKEPYPPQDRNGAAKRSARPAAPGCGAANGSRGMFGAKPGEVVLVRTKDPGDTARLVDRILAQRMEAQDPQKPKWLAPQKNVLQFLPEMASKRCVVENMEISDNLCLSNMRDVSVCTLVKGRMLRYLEDLFKKEYAIGAKVRKVHDLDEIGKYALLFRRIAISKARYLLVEDPWTCNDERVCRFIIAELCKAAERGMAVLVVTASPLDFGVWYDREIACENIKEGRYEE